MKSHVLPPCFKDKLRSHFLWINSVASSFFIFSCYFADELRPSSNEDLLLPTIHPNSVLPYHPVDPEYEDYNYDDEEDDQEYHVTQPYVPYLELKTTPAPQVISFSTPMKINWKSASSTNVPKFVLEPRNAYIIRGQPATLSCKVIHADKAYFTCNGEAMAASEMHKEVDNIEISENSETMQPVTVKTLSLQLDRINIEEFFGLYTCRCDAWSTKGMTSSKNASVEVACKSCFSKFSRFIGLLIKEGFWKCHRKCL